MLTRRVYDPSGTSGRRRWSAARSCGACACTWCMRGVARCCWRARPRRWTRCRPTRPRPSCARASPCSVAGSTATWRSSFTSSGLWECCCSSTWRSSYPRPASSLAASGGAMRSSPLPNGKSRQVTDSLSAISCEVGTILIVTILAGRLWAAFVPSWWW